MTLLAISERCVSVLVSLLGIVLCQVLICGISKVKAAQATPPQLPHDDAVLINEAYHLWQSLGEKEWTGWTQIRIPFIYITPDYEYAIDFPKTINGFTPLPQSAWIDKPIQARKRVLGTHLSASFPFEGAGTVVMGTPAALEKSPAAWVLTATHEMFHVLQDSRGEIQKIAQLKIGPEGDPSWILNFPFPYKDTDVMQLIHLQGYPIYLSLTEQDDAALKYDAGVAVEAIRVYRDLLRKQSAENKFYNYSQFQELGEGIAFYTEYKMAEDANGSYQPNEAFRRLPNYKSYQQVWDEDYKNRLFLVEHAGRAAQSRTAFYHLGLGKGLLLDRILPDWKTRYFAPGVWIDDLLMEALGQPSEIPVLTVGSPAPAFNLTALAGERLSLDHYRGKVVLLDFWQTWCVPCVEAIPHLKSLQQKYKDQGLVVLGVSDKLDQEGINVLRKFASDYSVSYPLLIDDKGLVAAKYAITGYPHLFIIDGAGRIALERQGVIDDKDLEQEILETLRRAPN